MPTKCERKKETRFRVFLSRSRIRFPRLAIISWSKRSHVSLGMFRVKKRREENGE